MTAFARIYHYQSENKKWITILPQEDHSGTKDELTLAIAQAKQDDKTRLASEIMNDEAANESRNRKTEETKTTNPLMRDKMIEEELNAFIKVIEEESNEDIMEAESYNLWYLQDKGEKLSKLEKIDEEVVKGDIIKEEIVDEDLLEDIIDNEEMAIEIVEVNPEADDEAKSENKKKKEKTAGKNATKTPHALMRDEMIGEELKIVEYNQKVDDEATNENGKAKTEGGAATKTSRSFTSAAQRSTTRSKHRKNNTSSPERDRTPAHSNRRRLDPVCPIKSGKVSTNLSPVKRKKVVDEPKEDPSDFCDNFFRSKVHPSMGHCQVCVTRLSPNEKRLIGKQGRHVRVNRTRGGCIDCRIFPSKEGEKSVRLCRQCFFDTHKQGKRVEKAFCRVTMIGMVGEKG